MTLPYTVATIDEHISACGVGACITAEVDIGTLQLLGVTIATHGDHGPPQLLDILVDEIGETGIDITGGDAVDTGKVPPFVGEGFGHMDAAGLGDVIRGLFLRIVGDVAGRAGGDDEAARATFLEMSTDGLGTVEGAVEIGLDDLVPVLDGTVQDATVGGPTGVGDEGIDLAKVGDHVLDQLLHALPGAHITLVGPASDTIRLAQILGVPFTPLRS